MRLIQLSPLLPVLAVACGDWRFHHCHLWAEDPWRRPMRVTVVEVIDGDTFDVEPPVLLPDGTEQDRVRPLCIDTPELADHECYAEEALARLVALLEGQEVTLRFVEDPVGEFGRVLAYVLVDGELLNLQLVEEGYALPIDEYFGGYACYEEVVEAAQAARDADVGGWAVCHGAPWEL
ncbi:MAG: thermonuclease family protein [Pseudomonadota bacterium]